jgi:endonuclease VIII
MPEGPEIWRAAMRIHKMLGDGPLQEATFTQPKLAHAPELIMGASVLSIHPRGKAMLTSFSTGHTLYSHNQLYGVWRVYKAGAAVKPTTRALRVRLRTVRGVAELLSATDVELWRTEDLHQHPFLARVGPDILDPEVNVDVVHQRLRSFPKQRARLGGLLLDQRFFCGVGNYLRAEIMWHACLRPDRTLASLVGHEQRSLAQALVDIPRASLKHRYARGDNQFRFAVFAKEGQPCPRCGDVVVRVTDAGRRLYLCEACQG